MGECATNLEQLVKQAREKRLRELSPKELKRVMYKKIAGLSPMGKIAAAEDSAFATRIFLERKKSGKKPN